MTFLIMTNPLGLSVAWRIFTRNTGVAGVAPTHTTGLERKQQTRRYHRASPARRLPTVQAA
jgi:hypothetical protein